jgi:F0F1-type ATP synthase assembly protein I
MTLTIQYIDAARNAWCNEEAMADESNIPPKKYGGLRDYVKAEQMVQLALAVPAGCFVGLLFGSWLDRHFHQHWISVAGMLLGSAAGFVQIFTTISRISKRGDE